MSGSPNHNNSLPVYKLVVVGDNGVGRSALVTQFICKRFLEDYNPVVEETYIKHTEVDGVPCILSVDTRVGQEEYETMRELYTRQGDGFLLVYSVTDPVSFEHIMQHYTKILDVKALESFPMILVANKVDLVHLRKVTEEQGRELSSKLNIPYIETSPKTSPEVVNECFHQILRILRNHRSEQTIPSKSLERKCVIT